MTLVRPTDQGSLIISVNSICDQIERWARGEEQVVTNPQLRGELLAPSTVSTAALTAGGVTLGKLATSFADAPPGYVVASGATTSAISIGYNTNTSEANAVTLVTASAFTADGVRPVQVAFFAPYWQNFSTTQAILELSLFDGASSAGRFASAALPGTNNRFGPVAGATRITPSAGTHTLSVRFWCSSGTTSDSAQMVAAAGGAGALLPMVIQVSVI